MTDIRIREVIDNLAEAVTALVQTSSEAKNFFHKTRVFSVNYAHQALTSPYWTDLGEKVIDSRVVNPGTNEFWEQFRKAIKEVIRNKFPVEELHKINIESNHLTINFPGKGVILKREATKTNQDNRHQLETISFYLKNYNFIDMSQL